MGSSSTKTKNNQDHRPSVVYIDIISSTLSTNVSEVRSIALRYFESFSKERFPFEMPDAKDDFKGKDDLKALRS
uniref:Uncharacterized protein n=1 Tax=Daphnia galeata TaxID=27404 RepID=A0A8J2RR64_9CRUS|nr:unnamed protein product [Daphnia galeata]